MHLDISGLRRRQQARAILDHVGAGEPLPTILMGDCNEWRNRGGCLADFGAQHHLVDTGHSFHSRRPVAKLDRIFASPELEPVDAGVRLVGEQLHQPGLLVAGDLAHLRRDHLLFCYLHLAAEPALTGRLLEIGLTGVAFETVELPNGDLPLLALVNSLPTPMPAKMLAV